MSSIPDPEIPKIIVGRSRSHIGRSHRRNGPESSHTHSIASASENIAVSSTSDPSIPTQWPPRPTSCSHPKPSQRKFSPLPQIPAPAHREQCLHLPQHRILGSQQRHRHHARHPRQNLQAQIPQSSRVGRRSRLAANLARQWQRSRPHESARTRGKYAVALDKKRRSESRKTSSRTVSAEATPSPPPQAKVWTRDQREEAAREKSEEADEAEMRGLRRSRRAGVPSEKALNGVQ
jgi:hypothetical protein